MVGFFMASALVGGRPASTMVLSSFCANINTSPILRCRWCCSSAVPSSRYILLWLLIQNLDAYKAEAVPESYGLECLSQQWQGSSVGLLRPAARKHTPSGTDRPHVCAMAAADIHPVACSCSGQRHT